MLKQVDGGVKIQPAMTISADFAALNSDPKKKNNAKQMERLSPHVRIKMALGFIAGGQFRVIGYRFETPEGIYGVAENARPGVHDFFHAQPIVAFTKGGNQLDLLFKDGEYPDKQPSFPLAADCLVTFALSVFVSLYGRRFLTDVSAEGVIPAELLEFIGIHTFPKANSCLSAR